MLTKFSFGNFTTKHPKNYSDACEKRESTILYTPRISKTYSDTHLNNNEPKNPSNKTRFITYYSRLNNKILKYLSFLKARPNKLNAWRRKYV